MGAVFMPEAFFCMWLKPTDSYIQKHKQPRNPHLGAGPEVPAYNVNVDSISQHGSTRISDERGRLPGIGKMGKYFGVFGNLFLFNDRLDGGKPFYENVVIRQLRERARG